MIHFKTEKEMVLMEEGGKRLRASVEELMPFIQVGLSTLEIDQKAEALIRKNGGEPSFKKVDGFYWTTCLPINEQVVHTPPSKRVLKNGDVLTVDIGMYYQGYHTDYADTVIIGNVKDKAIKRFLDVGKKTLYMAIDQAKKGNRLGQISQTIEKEIYGHGYKIFKQLTGHGIGKDLHEDPYVFGFLEKPVDKTIPIRPGLVIAIEVIYSQGAEKFVYEKDNDWSVVSADGSMAACFEHTVAITEDGTKVLT